MTASRNVWLSGVCTLALAAGSACRSTPAAAAHESAIDFVVWPNAATRVPSGSFDVRGIDNDEHVRVGIGSGFARTLRVRMPAGAYAVAWTPAEPESTAGGVNVAQDTERQEWPHIIVVADDGPTTVGVHLPPHGSRTEPRLELASAGPGLAH